MIAPNAEPDLIASLRALLSAGQYREVVTGWLAAPEAEARRSEALLLAATASMRLGDVARAGKLAGDAAEAFRLRADQDGRLRAVNLLGAVAFERGELDEAASRFETARSLARQLDDTLFEAHAANNLASVAHLRGDPAVALSLYRVALLAYQRLGDRRGTAQTYHNLGLTFRELSAWADADEATVQALRHARMVEDEALAAIAVTGRAELDLARGALDVASRGLDRASELAFEAGDAIGIARRVDDVVGLAVALQETLQPQALGAFGRAQDDGAGGTLLDQRDAAQDQRANDALAEIGLGDDQRAQTRGAEQQDLDRTVGDDVDERGAARERSHFAGEVARFLAHDWNDVAEAVALADGDGAAQDDEHAHTGLAARYEALARSVALDRGEAPHALDVRGAEPREHFAAATQRFAWRFVHHLRLSVSGTDERWVLDATDATRCAASASKTAAVVSLSIVDRDLLTGGQVSQRIQLHPSLGNAQDGVRPARVVRET